VKSRIEIGSILGDSPRLVRKLETELAYLEALSDRDERCDWAISTEEYIDFNELDDKEDERPWIK
jgi:hypothetical protein